MASAATLKDIQLEWEKDSKIASRVDLSAASSEIPIIHSKYMGYSLTYRGVLRRNEKKLRELISVKIDYYQGRLDQKTLKEYGWDQYQGPTPTKTLLKELLERDFDVIDQEGRVSECEYAVEFIKEIIKCINNLNWTIRNSIEWKKFENGIN